MSRSAGPCAWQRRWPGAVTALALATIAGLVSSFAWASELRIGIATFPRGQAHPLYGTSYPETLALNLVYDSLIYLDEDGKPNSRIARRWWMDESGDWRFELQPGLEFSNGEKLDADAVVRAIRFLAGPEGRTHQLGNILRVIVDADTLGPLTLRIRTAGVTPLLPLSLRLVRIPAPAAFAATDDNDFARRPVGSGPYRVVRWDDNAIVLEPNPKNTESAGAPSLKILKIPDTTARLQGLLSGALDIAIGLDPDGRRVIEETGIALHPRREPSVNYAAFVTTEDENLADPRVRVAINHAVGKQRIIDAFLESKTEVASQFAHPAAFGFNETLEPYRYDPPRARQLLAESGKEEGFPMVILIVPGVGINASAIYQQIALDLRAVGIEAEIRGIPQTKKVRHMYEGGWPGNAYAVTYTGYDPLETFRAYGCDRPFPIHCDRELEALVEAALGVRDIEERRLLTEAILARQRANPPGLLLWHGVSFDGVSPSVSGYRVVQDRLDVESLRLEAAAR